MDFYSQNLCVRNQGGYWDGTNAVAKADLKVAGENQRFRPKREKLGVIQSPPISDEWRIQDGVERKEERKRRFKDLSQQTSIVTIVKKVKDCACISLTESRVLITAFVKANPEQSRCDGHSIKDMIQDLEIGAALSLENARSLVRALGSRG